MSSHVCNGRLYLELDILGNPHAVIYIFWLFLAVLTHIYMLWEVAIAEMLFPSPLVVVGVTMLNLKVWILAGVHHMLGISISLIFKG